MTDAPETIVLLHGFTQTGRSWEPIAAALAERYRSVLAPDLRGHGTESDRRPVSFDAIIDDVLALVPGDEPFALAGYSMGGRIALTLALAAPDRVARLALIGASPGIADPGARVARHAADEQLAHELERDGLEPFARRWGAQPLFASQPPEVAARAHEERMRNTAAGLAASLRGVGTGSMPSLWDRLETLTSDTTLVAGEHDARFRAVNERMATLIPHATVHLVAGAGHAVPLEQPGALAHLLS